MDKQELIIPKHPIERFFDLLRWFDMMPIDWENAGIGRSGSVILLRVRYDEVIFWELHLHKYAIPEQEVKYLMYQGKIPESKVRSNYFRIGPYLINIQRKNNE